jgi:hypothetical protein
MESAAPTRLPRHRHPIWSGSRSAPNKPRSDFIACRERIPGSCRENGDAGEPFLSPSFRRGPADNDSIGPEFALRRHPIPRDFPTVPREGRRPCSLSVHPPQLIRALFRPWLIVPRDCAARLCGAISSRPGLASDGAVPARSGRSARWLAVPSRCPTRDARPRRGP